MSAFAGVVQGLIPGPLKSFLNENLLFVKFWNFKALRESGMDAKNDLIYSWTSFPSLVAIHFVRIGCSWEAKDTFYGKDVWPNG